VAAAQRAGGLIEVEHGRLVERAGRRCRAGAGRAGGPAGRLGSRPGVRCLATLRARFAALRIRDFGIKRT
jgi:hypothetical protein